jgi:hypothetical protein
MTAEVIIPRKALAVRSARIAACVALGAVPAWLLAPAPRPGVLVERTPVPITVRVPAPSEPARNEPAPATVQQRRVGCTLPVSHIGLIGDLQRVRRSRDDLRGVAASSTGCTLAVWGFSDVWVSRDDGASFTKLAIAGTTADPRAASFPVAAVGANESVYVLRADRLEIEHRDGTTHHTGVPGRGFDRIHASNGWVVLRSRDQLAASRDDGATWQVQPLPQAMARMAAAVRATSPGANQTPGSLITDPEAMNDASVFVDEHGAIRLAATSPDEPVAYYVGDVRGGAWRTVWTSPPPRNVTVNGQAADMYRSINAFAFGNDGQLYAERADAFGLEIFVVSPSGAVSTLPRLPARSPLRGASLAGMSGNWGARDAHGQRVYVLHGRGPIRTAEEAEYMALQTYQQGRGRWLVDGIVP